MTSTPTGLSRGAHWLPVSLALARRSLVATVRVPVASIPLVLMPLFFLIAFSGAFAGLADLPDFPTDRAVSWVLPFAVVQGAAFAGMGSGFGAMRDLQSGFFDRLLLLPGSRAGLLLGPLWASVVRAGLTSALVFGVGLALGAEFHGGLLGLLMVAVAALGVGALALAWTLGLIYRIPDLRAFALVQVGIFFPTFVSTGQVPLSQQTGWARQVARVNPVTNILELARQGHLGQVAWSTTWPGLLALVLSLLVVWTFAARGIRRLIP